MAYNETTAERIRSTLKGFTEEFTEKRMFGGLSFLYKGKMTIGIVKDDLAVRVLDHKMPDELTKPYVRPMDFTKRSMREFIYVSEEGFTTESQLHHYITLGLEHAKTKLK